MDFPIPRHSSNISDWEVHHIHRVPPHWWSYHAHRRGRILSNCPRTEIDCAKTTAQPRWWDIVINTICPMSQRGCWGVWRDCNPGVHHSSNSMGSVVGLSVHVTSARDSASVAVVNSIDSLSCTLAMQRDWGHHWNPFTRTWDARQLTMSVQDMVQELEKLLVRTMWGNSSLWWDLTLHAVLKGK